MLDQQSFAASASTHPGGVSTPTHPGGVSTPTHPGGVSTPTHPVGVTIDQHTQPKATAPHPGNLRWLHLLQALGAEKDFYHPLVSGESEGVGSESGGG